jgi:hypothetical protein
MIKDASLSLRIDGKLKEDLQQHAAAQGRTLASYIERALMVHGKIPFWMFEDPQPLHRKKGSPRVALSVAVGWPSAELTADHAERLGKELIKAAEIARKMPPG